VVLLGLFPGTTRGGEVLSLYEYGADEMGYLSLPNKQPQGSILMIPDAFGPRGVVKQRCDLLAKLGYVTLAVDLYNGSASQNPEIANRLQGKLEHEAMVKAIQAGMRLLSESPRYKTNTVSVAVWGENFQATVAAATGLETFTPDAISWLEPDGLDSLIAMTGYRVPLQIILRQESVGDTYEAGIQRFNQLRGIDCEVRIIERERGFLLEPNSSPEGVEAWTALINYWEEITDGSYQPEVVSGGEKLRKVIPVAPEKPRSIVTRPKLQHPRLN